MLCADISISQKNASLLAIQTPFYFPDGDPYQLFIREMPGGVLRLSDMGHSIMHLSYENDVDKFREGTRGNLFNQIKAETFVEENDGKLHIDTPVESLATDIFRLSEAITRITDLTFLNRARAESTFYEDLKEQLTRIVSEEKITKDYFYEEMENAQDYWNEYRIEGKHSPLFLFVIPNKDNARLTTIILERLLRSNANFDSLLIFSDQSTIPRSDLARLSNAGGEMIASLDAETDFHRKLLRKVA